MRKPYVITVEQNVPMPSEASIFSIHRETLLGMQYGDSFFLPVPADEKLHMLISYGRSIGVILIGFYSQQDPLTGAAGYRVWRVAESAVEAPVNKAAKSSTPTEKPVPPAKVKTTTAEAVNAWPGEQKTRYWHHAESECVLITKPGEHGYEGNGAIEEINEETYNILKDKYAATKPTWIGEEHETWWRLTTGRCVVVPAEKNETAKSTKGAVQISKQDYEAWVAKQNEEL